MLYNIMPFFQSIPNSLQDLGTALSSITNGSDVYFYKDNTGAIQAYNNEHPLSTSNFGYPFQFIDGTVNYTAITITNLNQIPWTFPYTTLTASNSNLWNSSLMIWIDALEPKAISNSLQKVVSKDYTNNLIIVENTTNFSFVYASPNLSITNNSSLETSAVQPVYAYFKLGMVFTLPTQTLNTVLYQHNRLKIKLSSQTAPDATIQSMICIFDNDIFKKGIMLKPNDLAFKYQLYTDNVGNFVISENTSVLNGTPSYYQATSAKIFIGSDSTKNYPSNMILHELLLYESASNDIVATSAIISTYFTARHSLLTYNDTSNIAPYTDPYEAYLATGSLRLFTGDWGNITGTTWLTFNSVGNDLNRFNGQCGINNNQNGCLKCISLANTQYVSGSSGITTITPFTVVILVRWTVNGGLTIVKFGSSPAFWLIDALSSSGNLRINYYSGVVGYYVDYNTGMALNTWYILTYKYSGGLLSNATVRVNGVTKSVIQQGDGTPVIATTNDWTLPLSSGGTMFYGGLYLNNTAMSNGNIEKVEGFFAHRLFSSGAMLGALHPYYSVPPTF